MRSLKITPNIQSRSAIFSKYVNDVRKIKIKDEVEILSKIKGGDDKALDILVENNLLFVVSVAKQYSDFGIPIEDLINEGNIGLIKASRLFNYDCGLKFISYAVWHIRANIQNHINSLGHVVKIPYSKISNSIKLKNLVNQKEQEYGCEISHGLAIHLFDEYDKENIDYFYLKHGKPNSSLDKNIGEDDDMFSLNETMLLNDETWKPDNLNESIEETKILKWGISQLNHNEQTIVLGKLGFEGYEKTFEVLSKELNINIGTVKNIYRSSLKKLKKLYFIYNPYTTNTTINLTKRLKKDIKIIEKEKRLIRKIELDKKLSERKVVITEKSKIEKNNNNIYVKNMSNKLVNDTSIEKLVLDIFFNRPIGGSESDRLVIRNISKRLDISKGEVLGIINRYRRSNK